MEYKYYLVEKKGHIAWVWLNRPEKKNAMNPPAWKETIPIFEDLDEDDNIRVVILAAKGSDFNTGLDLVEMLVELNEITTPVQSAAQKRSFLKKLLKLQDGLTCIEKCRKPVIAAVHGMCLGGGLDMITACDIRLATKDARFSLLEASVGMVADVGVLQRIPNIIGQGNAREMAYSCRKISAAKALRINLVNDIFENYDELLKEAEILANEIAANSPLAVQASKVVLKYGIGKSVEDGLLFNAAVSNYTIPSNDVMAAFKAFAEKKKPEFTGS
ncbi:MAG TPA: crotonase/enoyl-CoA hydratase family protein [Spirochaetota bacterium]|nr:crotonase/enoyl-CoA hydratase family protein [Spirochaetota bacterium]